MIITSLRKRRNKIFLYFDNSERLEVEYEVYLSSGSAKGDEVGKNRIENLVSDNEIFQTKNSAYRYLGNRNHSSFELRQKLSKKGYQQKIIQKVMLELNRKGYIDDHKFAESFVRMRVERRKEGIVKINSELRKRGISNEIIFDVISDSENDPIHYDNALDLAKKKYNTLKYKSLEYSKLKGRLFNFLKGKGYKPDIVFTVIDDILKNEEYNYEDI